jgi:hypothetical protein
VTDKRKGEAGTIAAKDRTGKGRKISVPKLNHFGENSKVAKG